MNHIRKVVLAIGLMFCFTSSYADVHCGAELGAPTKSLCNITKTGEFTVPITVPNTVTIGQELYKNRGNVIPQISLGTSEIESISSWGIIRGTSLDGVCPGADNTMFASGDGSCLTAIQFLDFRTGQAIAANTVMNILDNRNGDGDDYSWWSIVVNVQAYIRVIYLGSGEHPANMPQPPELYLVDSITQTQSDIIYASSSFHTAPNTQTCAGGGVTITLDPAVATVDVGSTFGTAKQSTYNVQCPKMVAGNYSLQASFSGPVLDDYTGFGKSSGTAEGVGFQMKVNNTAVSNGSVISDIPVDTNGIVQLNFDVSYIKTAPTVTPGDISSAVTISYLYQ